MINQCKKIISILLIACISACLSACGNSESNSNIQVEVQENRLSDSCDKVLASGYDSNGNYYELVANESEEEIIPENYYDLEVGERIQTEVSIAMGIIKNNVWLIELTEESPLISSDYGWYYARAAFLDGVYNYIGAGCFSNGYDVWNGNTGESYHSPENYKLCTQSGYDEITINNEGLFLLYNEYYQGKYKLLDANIMSITEIDLNREYSNEYVYPYSEGLFAVVISGSSKAAKNGFYDAKGKKVIDLSQYEIPNAYISESDGGYIGRGEHLVFSDGECTFKVKNARGTYYKITIDKTGKVIDSVSVN